MKLRIKNNSVRFRLSQDDLRRFLETGRIEERLKFGDLDEQQFIYSLERVDRSEEMTAIYHGGRLNVLVPLDRSNIWAETEHDALEGTFTSRSGKQISLSVEKDLECLHKETPAEDDAFPR